MEEKASLQCSLEICHRLTALTDDVHPAPTLQISCAEAGGAPAASQQALMHTVLQSGHACQ